MAKKQKNKQNYLDFVPVMNPDFSWKTDEEGIVTVTVIRKGIFDKIAQTIFRRPKSSQIRLDELGSFIWQKIDGERTIYDISIFVKEEFGEKAEPLLKRLIQFFEILKDNHFVSFKGEKAS